MPLLNIHVAASKANRAEQSISIFGMVEMVYMGYVVLISISIITGDGSGVGVAQYDLTLPEVMLIAV